MYHVLLTNRYLTSRVIPLIAVAAVALCVALVIIVVSVMTGFLDMVRSSGRTLMGDVIVSYPTQGIPYYKRLLEAIEALPEAEAASPLVNSWGLLKMPYPEGPNKEVTTVQIWGVEPESFARVTGYADALYWKPLTDDEAARVSSSDLRRNLSPQIVTDGLTLHDSRTDRPGIVLGMHVSIANRRQRDGSYHPLGDGYWWMPQFEVTLTTLPIDTSGGMQEPESFIFPVVNEFVSGVYLIDSRRVMIPIEIAQRLLHLDAGQIVDPDDFTTVIGQDPARATMVLVRAADGVTPDQLRERVEQVFDQFVRELRNDPDVDVNLPTRGLGASVLTWEQQQAEFIGPVEKERNLMRILFQIVYIVCAGLVLTIFWAIVYEKTRDIGILRSIGCSRIGISMIFLRYGFIIGAIGSIVGLGLAFLVVRNINTIHDALGQDAPPWLYIGVFLLATLALVMTIRAGLREFMLPVVLWSLGAIVLYILGVALMLHRGTLIWDPAVYYFAEIPNHIDVNTAISTMIGAVIFSVLGAFIPAAKAADTDPVQALRYE